MKLALIALLLAQVDTNPLAPPIRQTYSAMKITTCRVLDTRLLKSGPIQAQKDTAFYIGNQCGLTKDVEAIMVNITLIPKSPVNFLSIWGEGERPITSVINALDGQLHNNFMILPVGPNGYVTAFINTGEADLILDINAVTMQMWPIGIRAVTVTK